MLNRDGARARRFKFLVSISDTTVRITPRDRRLSGLAALTEIALIWRLFARNQQLLVRLQQQLRLTAGRLTTLRTTLERGAKLHPRNRSSG